MRKLLFLSCLIVSPSFAAFRTNDLTVTSSATVTHSVTAETFWGDGSHLTGITAAATNYFPLGLTASTITLTTSPPFYDGEPLVGGTDGHLYFTNNVIANNGTFNSFTMVGILPLMTWGTNTNFRYTGSVLELNINSSQKFMIQGDGVEQAIFDPTDGEINLGDITGVQNGVRINIDNPDRKIIMNSNFVPVFEVGVASTTTHGDAVILSTSSNSRMVLDMSKLPINGGIGSQTVDPRILAIPNVDSGVPGTFTIRVTTYVATGYNHIYPGEFTITPNVGNGASLDFISGFGTGSSIIGIHIDNNGVETYEPVKFFDADNSNYVALKASSTVTANNTYVLPRSSGTSGQAIVTDGNNNLTFATISVDTGLVSLSTGVFGVLYSTNLPSNVDYTDISQTISGSKTFTSSQTFSGQIFPSNGTSSNPGIVMGGGGLYTSSNIPIFRSNVGAGATLVMDGANHAVLLNETDFGRFGHAFSTTGGSASNPIYTSYYVNAGLYFEGAFGYPAIAYGGTEYFEVQPGLIRTLGNSEITGNLTVTGSQGLTGLTTGTTFYYSSGTVTGQLKVNSILWPNGTIQVSSPTVGGGGGSTIYFATATAGFPYGFTVSTITFIGQPDSLGIRTDIIPYADGGGGGILFNSTGAVFMSNRLEMQEAYLGFGSNRSGETYWNDGGGHYDSSPEFITALRESGNIIIAPSKNFIIASSSGSVPEISTSPFSIVVNLEAGSSGSFLANVDNFTVYSPNFGSGENLLTLDGSGDIDIARIFHFDVSNGFSYINSSVGILQTTTPTATFEVNGNEGIGTYYANGGAGTVPVDGLAVSNAIIAGGVYDSYLQLQDAGGVPQLTLNTDGTISQINFGLIVGSSLTVSGTSYIGWEKITNACGAGVTQCTATCSGGNVLTGGGCDGGVGLSKDFPVNDTQWECDSVAVTTLTAYAFCERVGN